MLQILLIEPDHILANLYSSSLESVGHKVIKAVSAQSAIHAADKIKPDIVILEPQLVNHSGIEFLYEFRSYPEWRDIPVLVLSGIPPVEFSGSQDLLIKELGVRSYHYKPQTSISELIAVVNKVAQPSV